METATLGKGKLFGPASFYKKALLIALPVMLQMLIQNMVSLIDNFMVSGLGDVKMSGVNISGQILFVFMVLLNTICTAGGSSENFASRPNVSPGWPWRTLMQRTASPGACSTSSSRRSSPGSRRRWRSSGSSRAS